MDFKHYLATSKKKWKNKIKIITKIWQNWKDVKEDTVKKKKHNAVSDIEEKNEKRGKLNQK